MRRWVVDPVSGRVEPNKRRGCAACSRPGEARRANSVGISRRDFLGHHGTFKFRSVLVSLNRAWVVGVGVELIM
jgi:hypothetical protein